MAKYADMLGDVFAALSDPTRRAVVRRLGAGEASVGDLAADTSMALPSFLKHVRVLEHSGLVRTSKSGRVRMCALRRDRFAAERGNDGSEVSHAVRMCALRRDRFAVIEDWLLARRRIWEERTDRLEGLVTDLDREIS